jgi:FkbM family methyltransferase
MEVRTRLTELANLRELNFFKDHVKYLRKLKSEGLEPKVIYDIGSCVLHWTNEAKNIWSDSKYVLFDAFEPAEFLYEGYDYHIGVLSDSVKTVEWWQNDMMPGGNSYYREIGRTDFFTDGMSTMRLTKTLDEVVKERGFPPPDFIKIDVQGCELDILKGATETLKSVKDLVVELQHMEYNKGAPQVQESLPFIESLGFKCVTPMFAYNGPDADYHFRKNTNTIL